MLEPCRVPRGVRVPCAQEPATARCEGLARLPWAGWRAPGIPVRDPRGGKVPGLPSQPREGGWLQDVTWAPFSFSAASLRSTFPPQPAESMLL